MNKSSLWEFYVQKNPQFAKEGEITLTTKGLRKMFDTTWDIAYREGESKKRDYLDPDSMGDLDALKSLFGFR